MNRASVVRLLLCLCATLLLLGLGWWTISGELRNLHQTRTIGQQVETAIQLVCGLLCIAAVVTRFRWRPLFRPLRIAWLVTLTAWVALSALVWGPPMPHVALLFAVVALLMACGHPLGTGTECGRIPFVSVQRRPHSISLPSI
jgi:hypothetical protein